MRLWRGPGLPPLPEKMTPLHPDQFNHQGAGWTRPMRRYSEAVKADVRRRLGPPHRQSVAQISQELGTHVITLYKWRKHLRLQAEVVPASQKDPRVGARPTSSLWCSKPRWLSFRCRLSWR